jgi:hypothetical protein
LFFDPEVAISLIKGIPSEQLKEVLAFARMTRVYWEEEIPAFAGIELNENTREHFKGKSPPIPAKAGISLYPPQ